MLDSSSGAASGRPALGWENVEGAILPQPSRRVRGTLGGVTDLAPLARAAASLLTRLRQTVGVSESSAGGLISAALLAIPGASVYFQGAGVIYTQNARRALLGVADESVKGIRSSTEAYALVGARAIREKLGTTWGLAETGATGPTGNRYGDAAGHACIAVAGPVERVVTVETGSADREANMWAFTRAALDLLTACLEESAKPH
jgi:PncC family amidohydrolase